MSLERATNQPTNKQRGVKLQPKLEGECNHALLVHFVAQLEVIVIANS
jgi:hypothetical protein